MFGKLHGYNEDRTMTFKPLNSANRAEAAVVISRLDILR